MHVGALYTYIDTIHTFSNRPCIKKYATEENLVEMLLFSEALVKKMRNNTMNKQPRATAYLV